ncbi:MAG: DUF1566 domain-containing protein, partial [Hyphomicrobiales bacterium]|nr:DUF1566 domain-containing protein [Hyphomicrobiales bacterium]
IRRLLNSLAYKAHVNQPELMGTADISEGDLVAGLVKLSNNPEVKPMLLVRHLCRRTGLIVPRGVEVYTFMHRTFQEYLAACCLTNQDYPDQISEFVRKDPDRWREVALLAGAKAGRGSESSVWLLAEALCYKEPDGIDKKEDIWGAQLAGQLLAKSADLNRISPRNKPKLERVKQWLVKITTDALLPDNELRIAFKNLAVVNYIHNDYEDQGEVVLDHATGLMWQKSGSDDYMEYEVAKTYIEKLNKDQFAGYDDWRLPTIYELMSLLEKEQSNR